VGGNLGIGDNQDETKHMFRRRQVVRKVAGIRRKRTIKIKRNDTREPRIAFGMRLGAGGYGLVGVAVLRRTTGVCSALRIFSKWLRTVS